MSAVKNFKEKLGPIAAKVEAETGIKAKLGMGQAAHESAYGTSLLSRPDAVLTIMRDNVQGPSKGPANNLFGFTAEPPTYWRKQGRPFVSMNTHEYKAGARITLERPFRAYQSWEESYRDWARLMQTEHYVKAGALDALKAGDSAAFAKAMGKAGYATDPNYEAKIARVIAEVEKVA